MKTTSKILLLALVTIGYGCSKTSYDTTPQLVPMGSFSGNFTKIHLNSKTQIIDTSKAIITLAISNTGLFKITGDTLKIHAGSHGMATLYSGYIQFIDSTATVINPPKIHLNGIYQYYYDGSIFQLGASNDTLKVLYDLKKS